MSTLAIVSPVTPPTPPAAPGSLTDAPASVRTGDVPRPGVVVQLSEQVRELQEPEKKRAEDRRKRERSPRQDGELTEDQERQVQELKKTDREVRSHEAAHKAVAGAYARGAPQFDTVVGPDGRRYAVGGEVAIDASPISGNPEATIQKMEQVARAALAPAQPSPQDRAVASQARQAAAEARRELLQEQTEEASSDGDETAPVDGTTSETDAAARPGEDTAPNEASADAKGLGHAGESARAAALHGHAAQDACPLCAAQGLSSGREHGSLDLSA